MKRQEEEIEIEDEIRREREKGESNEKATKSEGNEWAQFENECKAQWVNVSVNVCQYECVQV